MADLLDSETETLVSLYQKKCGASATKVREMLNAETWFTAEEAVDIGLADTIVGDNAVKNAAPSPFKSLVAETRATTDQRQMALWRVQRTVEAMRAKSPRNVNSK